MGRADWETLLLLYLLFGTKYTRPIFQVNPSITTLSTFAPFLPHHRRVTQELALNSLAKVREESRSLSPDRWLFFSFFPRLSRRRFVWAAVSRSKSKSFNKRLLPSVVARTLAWAATKRGGKRWWRAARELNACSFVTVRGDKCSSVCRERYPAPAQNRG